MKFVLREPTKINIFTNIFQGLYNVNQDVNFQFNKHNLYIQTMDSAQICLFELRLEDTWFDEYNVDDTDDNIVGVNTMILHKILKCKDEDHIITFTYNDSPDSLQIHFEEGKIDKTFNIPTMELDIDVLQIPDQSVWQADFELNSIMFQNLTSEFMLFGEDVKFHCSEEMLSMTSEGDMGKYVININVDDLNEFTIEEETTLNTKYSLKYFNIATGFVKISKQVSIHVSDELPLKINYSLGNSNKNYVRFFLAPKVIDE
jgi:proliferating cell nuclear antigen PCNA